METNAIPDAHIIHNATTRDIGAVANILGSAFSEDPVFRWVCDTDPIFYRDMFYYEAVHHYQFHDHVFINGDGTGAALWLPPGIGTSAPFKLGKLGLLFKMVLRGGLSSLSRGGTIGRMMSEAHIKTPHYYLHAIGAHLDHQGKGIGSALLKHGTRICDEHKTLAYLESSNERNNPLYERFGFEITGEINLPENGPTLWLMERQPNPI